MTEKDIAIGDIVVVRDVDDMEAEFGDCRENVPFGFVDGMYQYCGHKYKVVDLVSNPPLKKVMIEPIEDGPLQSGYNFSAEMFRSACPRTNSLRKHKLGVL